MEPLRIVFLGTPEFAVATLDHLIKHKYHVVGVITAPDRPAGRGRKLHGSAVKEYAQAHGLKVLQPTNLKDALFLEDLKALRANLQVVVAFRMLPREVWQMPKYGTFNLHASLLPNYRGAAPINWAIINGETETGVTTFYIDDKIDTGEIIWQEKTNILPDETAGSLHDKLMELGAILVIKTIQLIEQGKVERKKQGDVQKLKSANKIHKETCRIDWNRPLDAIYNHIRGLSPYPTAWTNLHNAGKTSVLKIYSGVKTREVHTFKNGTLLHDKKNIKVAVPGGFLELQEVQLPGKRKMKVQELLNGTTLSATAHVH
ncbi:methionyl-tRNA formyltransferase [Flavobacteriaceae bacterium F89]|uniref:Methionyl-tRNA formyltransferase n=1 Tax=Cerina litoralis TaxID=2874477 RepID=A0AAE3ETJ9_9FLAO|nr:methionyl-tRNA formyltransferase [Cerina litoralis]MCG2459979.1 methionyl-tRNA formyltransferase [Cerina litoralis]